MLIKKIFDKVFDEEVHSDLIKFGRGEFKDKYLLEAKKQKDRYVVKTGPEFANYLVRKGMEKVQGRIKVTGVIVSTFDIRAGMGGFVFSANEEVKQFMGIKQLKVDSEVEPKKVLEVMEKFPRAFFALSFVLPEYELKIKAKAPKSAKPSVKGEKESKPEFCSLKTTSEGVIGEIFFDCKDFKEISVRHSIKVNDVIYPKDLKNMKAEEIREKSKRKGVVVRAICLDGVEKVREAEFEA